MSSGRLPEVVVYERFQCKALTENIFGVLGRWSPTGGGGTFKARGGSFKTVLDLVGTRLHCGERVGSF